MEQVAETVENHAPARAAPRGPRVQEDGQNSEVAPGSSRVPGDCERERSPQTGDGSRGLKVPDQQGANGNTLDGDGVINSSMPSLETVPEVEGEVEGAVGLGSDTRRASSGGSTADDNPICAICVFAPEGSSMTAYNCGAALDDEREHEASSADHDTTSVSAPPTVWLRPLPSFSSGLATAAAPASFRFQNMWYRHPKFMALVEEVWGLPVPHSGMARLKEKLLRLKQHLRHWNKAVVGDIFRNLAQAETQAREAERQFDLAPTETNLATMNKATALLQRALSVEEDFWKQKLACKWVSEGR
ncbi:hypothetical protein Salat_2914500 [Sesamum alatum]|uniref:Uncharacterized protein n=1 Tax=Sesamum alatum TaxID=300844 RepID=A0AAE1XJ39_9LAMI|nr:hypothetical protein Salat_2914500 [Sesamum alatum]